MLFLNYQMRPETLYIEKLKNKITATTFGPCVARKVNVMGSCKVAIEGKQFNCILFIDYSIFPFFSLILTIPIRFFKHLEQKIRRNKVMSPRDSHPKH